MSVGGSAGFPERRPLGCFSGKRVLMLQGPMGPFFHRLARDLKRAGAEVFRINFNGGDWLFYPTLTGNFRGGPGEWPDYFRQALAEWRIDAVFLYGDRRPVHQAAIEICEQASIPFYSFEEGYLRPDFITMEKGLTNGGSALPGSALFYLNLDEKALGEAPAEKPVGNAFPYMALWAFLYHLAAFLLRPFFPGSAATYHRGLGLVELPPQLRSIWQKIWYAWWERGSVKRLTKAGAPDYFLVPLQVAGDSQLLHHSDYGDGGVKKFIAEVMQSFSEHAPEETLLVFKHHPRDRGYTDYTALIRRLATRLKIRERVLYIHDQRLPPLLDGARGVVVINSTVGLSGIVHNRPVKVCGRSIYDMPGLTAPVSLDAFWKRAEEFPPDPALFDRFKRYMISRTLLNGSFYKRLKGSPLSSGIVWNPAGRAPSARVARRPEGDADRGFGVASLLPD